MSEDFEDFKERVRSEREIRAQRDAAESLIPGERLRREIREAFDDERDRRSGPQPPEPRPDGPRRDETTG